MKNVEIQNEWSPSEGFTWDVSESGYEVLQESPGATIKVQRYLVPCRSEEPTLYSTYFLDNERLFEEFASLSLKNDEIVNFANRYGQLTSTDTEYLSSLPGRTMDFMDGSTVYGEPVEFWHSHISLMKIAFNLWKLALDRSSATKKNLSAMIREVSGRFELLDNGVVIDFIYIVRSFNDFRYPNEYYIVDVPRDIVVQKFFPKMRGMKISQRDFAILLRKEFPRIEKFYLRDELFSSDNWDISMIAKLFVQKLINKSLKADVVARINWSSQNSRSRLRIVPRNLIGALWFQFAKAVDGNVKYRKCAVCPLYFGVSKEDPGSRADRKTCSNRCRQRLSLLRKKVGYLRQTQRTVQHVSKALNIEPEVSVFLLKDEKSRKRRRKK